MKIANFTVDVRDLERNEVVSPVNFGSHLIFISICLTVLNCFLITAIRNTN